MSLPQLVHPQYLSFPLIGGLDWCFRGWGLPSTRTRGSNRQAGVLLVSLGNGRITLGAPPIQTQRLDLQHARSRASTSGPKRPGPLAGARAPAALGELPAGRCHARPGPSSNRLGRLEDFVKCMCAMVRRRLQTGLGMVVQLVVRIRKSHENDSY